MAKSYIEHIEAIIEKPFNDKTTTERLALIAGVLQPLMTLPQVIIIFLHHSASDVSLLTWLGYLVLGLPFLFYGITHRLRPVLVTQILYIILQTSVVIGVLIYGH